MSTDKKQIHLKNMIATCIVMFVVIGFVGTVIPAGGFQILFWGFSSFFMIVGAALLASKLTRDGHDIPASGFNILAIGHAMFYGFLATGDAGNEQFGAGIAILVPGLILISLYNLIPMVFRILGWISAIAFLVLAILIYRKSLSETQQGILSMIAYTTMNLNLLNWSWRVYKRKI